MLRSVQILTGLQSNYSIVIYVATIFSTISTSSVLQVVASNSSALKSICKSQIQQRQLIAALEWYFTIYSEGTFRYFPVLLKHLFDENILEEDTLLEWSTDTARNGYTIASIPSEILETLRKTAERFVVWLQEADDDDDDEDITGNTSEEELSDQE